MDEPLRMLWADPKKEESLKTPRLAVIGRVLWATTENGGKLAALLMLQNGPKHSRPHNNRNHLGKLAALLMPQNGPTYGYACAKDILTERGYRTDWAEWRDDGAFVRLLEDVE